MPSFFATGLALLAAVSGVTAHYSAHPAPSATYAPVYPYHNSTHPKPYGTAPHPEYYTTTVCETKTYYDEHSSVYYETIPLYTTACPYTTKTYVNDYHTYTTVVPATTYYPPAHTYVQPTGTGVVPVAPYPTYATGAASALQVSGLLAAAAAVVAVAL